MASPPPSRRYHHHHHGITTPTPAPTIHDHP
jgi:hypothetical protein